MAVTLVFAAIVEELCFRRVVYVALRASGFGVAAIGSTVAWTMAAAASERASVMAVIALGGIVLAVCYERTRSLRLVIVIHAVANLAFLGLLARLKP
jgi:membrane protease YdiL (CAAX protease family)